VSDPQNPRLKIYESTPEPLKFEHGMRVADGASGEVTVRVGLRYQVCDVFRCLPPAEEFFDLKLKVNPG
jgi:hypothetical protein